MKSLFFLTLSLAVTMGGACSANLATNGASPGINCSESPGFARSLVVSRSENASEMGISDLGSGLSFVHAHDVRSAAGCPLDAVGYNIVSGEIAVRPDVKIVLGPDIRGGAAPPATVEMGAIAELPEGWGPVDTTADAPALDGYRFVSAAPVSGWEGAYVGIWERTGGDSASSIAASFVQLGSGAFSDPRILLRSALPLTRVFVGPGMHGDGRSFAVVQDLPGENRVRLLSFDWMSARYFQGEAHQP